MSQPSGTIPIKEAARLLGVRRETVSDLLEAHNLKPEPIPFSGRAKGVTPKVFRKLAKILNRDLATTV